MPLTRERKIYIGLLGVGLVALTADRLTRGGTGDARAQDSSEYVVARTDGQAVAKSSPAFASANNVGGAGGISDRLRELGGRAAPESAADRRDLFRVPRNWAPDHNVPPATGPVKEPSGGPAEFERAHRLTAVILSERQGQAVIDGRIYKPGQVLDGYTLLAVTQDAVVFRSKLGTAVLKPEVKPQQP
jgi:hypothetical protein